MFVKIESHDTNQVQTFSWSATLAAFVDCNVLSFDCYHVRRCFGGAYKVYTNYDNKLRFTVSQCSGGVK